MEEEHMLTSPYTKLIDYMEEKSAIEVVAKDRLDEALKVSHKFQYLQLYPKY